MLDVISAGLSYLTAQSGTSALALFWFTVLFEVPRYTLAFLTAALFPSRFAAVSDERRHWGRVSVVIAGHNENDAIERCVRSLHEQSVVPDEIIVVSDGSSDGMPAKLKSLLDRGLIDHAHSTDLRAGKSAAVNLGLRWASGDTIIIVDCDCSYDRHALKRVLAPFADPAIGAVSGNILVRNPTASLVTSFQAIEYLISISLGKQAALMKDQVVCVSGAFGAFRSAALSSVDGIDVGGGEDLDVTLRLREAGWKVAFAADAICYTDVPETMRAFVNQRFRWEGDTIRIRYRKHAGIINPFSPRFRLSELLHEIDFVVFHILGAAVLPVYILWLFVNYGDLAVMILLAAQAGLLVLDMSAFLLAALATPKAASLSLLPYVAGYGLFNGIVVRFLRLAAYVREWVLNASAEDNYVPAKVRLVRRW